jgi:hypothetical protein
MSIDLKRKDEKNEESDKERKKERRGWCKKRT